MSEWTKHPAQHGQCVNCGEIKTGTFYLSSAAGGAFCAECYADGDT